MGSTVALDAEEPLDPVRCDKATAAVQSAKEAIADAVNDLLLDPQTTASPDTVKLLNSYLAKPVARWRRASDEFCRAVAGLPELAT